MWPISSTSARAGLSNWRNRGFSTAKQFSAEHLPQRKTPAHEHRGLDHQDLVQGVKDELLSRHAAAAMPGQTARELLGRFGR